MNILWIGGWAIPIEYIKNQVETAFSKVNSHKYNHSFIYPNKNYIKFIKNPNFDIIIGYSLGATLLLFEKEIISIRAKKYYIAPFLNIEEATTVKETQLKFLLRKLKLDPIHSIEDFYMRAYLAMEDIKELPYPLRELCWGIEMLIQSKEFVVKIYDDSNRILLGSEDPLVNQKFFERNFNSLKIIKGANHELKSFLPELSNSF